MKKTVLTLLTALSLSACRSMILEDRRPCPSFLFFDIQNAELFEDYNRVFVSAMDYHSGTMYSCDTTVVSDIQDRSFCLKVPRSDATKGFGLIGFKDLSIEEGTKLVIEEGKNGEPIYRFDYISPSRNGTELIPVEMVKDHAKVRVTFRRYDSFTGADGQFPFYIVIRGNTCGIDGLSGIPVTGPFSYRPPEEYAGTFRFIVPRQGDHSLTMELWAKEGRYVDQGLIRIFPLWIMFSDSVDFSWKQKDLPDIDLEIDYQETTYKVILKDWSDKNTYDLEF